MKLYKTKSFYTAKEAITKNAKESSGMGVETHKLSHK